MVEKKVILKTNKEHKPTVTAMLLFGTLFVALVYLSFLLFFVSDDEIITSETSVSTLDTVTKDATDSLIFGFSITQIGFIAALSFFIARHTRR